MYNNILLTEEQAMHLEKWKEAEYFCTARMGELRITSQGEMLEYMDKLTLKERTRRENLVQAVRDSGLSYSDLATILDCSKSAVDQYISGAKTPSLRTALIISRLFKKSVEELFGA